MDRIDVALVHRKSTHTASASFALAVVAALSLFSLRAAAADGERMASDHGCLNCHYSESHSSPTLQRLAGKLNRNVKQPEALQDTLLEALHEMRGQPGIHGHQRVSDESALIILRWMAQGDKAP